MVALTILGAIYIAKISSDNLDINERDKVTYKTLAILALIIVPLVIVVVGLNLFQVIKVDFIGIFILTIMTFVAVPVLIIIRNNSMAEHSFEILNKCYQYFKDMFT